MLKPIQAEHDKRESEFACGREGEGWRKRKIYEKKSHAGASKSSNGSFS